jgi:hypothetical protein
MLLINPGSTIGKSPPKGWTNSFARAKAEAERWLKIMHEDDGLTDVELLPAEDAPEEGRWTFYFRHKVTGVRVRLDTHGIDDLDAYRAQYVFTPRVYWNGSSTAEGKLDDFAAPGFRKIATFVKEPA